MSKIQESNMIQNGNLLQMKLKTSGSTELSDYITLCGLVKFQIKSNIVKVSSYTAYQTITIRLSKLFQTDRLIYSVKLTSSKFGIERKGFFVVDDDIEKTNWQIIYENNGGNTGICEFDLALSLDISSSIFSGFISLHDDTELVDFELRGTDGTVKVHKVVLAGYSPVLKTMLVGDWKETNSGFVQMEASMKTLNELKSYMYLHTLPNSDIKELAAIASLYMMTDLEECCTVRLLTSITAENAADLLDLSVKYNMKRLKLGILENVQRGLIKVEDMIKKSDADEIENQSMHPHILHSQNHHSVRRTNPQQ